MTAPEQVYALVERFDRNLDAFGGQGLVESGHDAGGLELAEHVAFVVETFTLECEDL